jgi:hypothetical protein
MENSTVLSADQENISLYARSWSIRSLLSHKNCEVKCPWTDRENPTRKGNSFAHRQGKATATTVSLRGRRLEVTERGQLFCMWVARNSPVIGRSTKFDLFPKYGRKAAECDGNAENARNMEKNIQGDESENERTWSYTGLQRKMIGKRKGQRN